MKTGTGHPFLLLLLLLFTGTSFAGWKTLDTGLRLGTFKAMSEFTRKAETIHVLQISPLHYRFRLVNALRNKEKFKTAKAWSEQHNLVAAINASMFHGSGKSVAYMKNGPYLNNKRITRDKIMFVSGPTKKGLREVRLFDRQCDNFRTAVRHYTIVVQNIRMLTCKGRNVWSRQPKFWSAALVGQDKNGNILFIHVRAPFSMHDLVNKLKNLPIRLDRLMYVEGGPEATLYIKAGIGEYEFVGSYETGFNENHDNKKAWKIPNVIGVIRK